MEIDVRIMDERIRGNMPYYSTPGSAGIDLRACIEQPLLVYPHAAHVVASGIAFNIKNPGYAGLIIPRSGLGHKHGIVISNLCGLIDSDYQGEVMIAVWNRSAYPYTIQPMERIAQMIFIPVSQAKFNIVEEFDADESERGDGGFGSTGDL